jgi:hypothetical protein
MLKAAQYDTSDQLGQEKDLLNRLTPYIAGCIAMQIPSGSNPQGKPLPAYFASLKLTEKTHK